MSYTINTPDVLHAGGYVQHGLENAGAVIAASNYEIANAIYGASESILNGFGKIRDELERKRCTEEYFQLLDRIDLLEDKIVAKGGDLNQVYDAMKISYEELIKVTPDEVWVLAYSLRTEENIEWLKNQIVFRKVTQPFELFTELFINSSIYEAYEGQRRIAWAQVDRFDVGRCMRLYFSSSVGKLKEYISIPEKLRDWLKWKSWLISCAEDLETEEYRRLAQLNYFISAHNSQITLSNLRSIHGGLITEYRKMKLNK